MDNQRILLSGRVATWLPSPALQVFGERLPGLGKYELLDQGMRLGRLPVPDGRADLGQEILPARPLGGASGQGRWDLRRLGDSDHPLFPPHFL